ncbi:major facilitator superfamily transporter [Nocardia nova SH22a]|uniref:Major facilitator superfamily transporter n=1 Tax=Nocardia nova SH22a TaxID=1415166 RepID=W5TKK9_9NOCA|nr:MFS transporter [Nocardia nova]AHH19709.1 major facilitator superfamily transporter [Nocardia nova SH22a]
MPVRETGHPKAVLGVVFLVMFLVSLDLSIVNVALPDIDKALDFSPSGLSWVINAFTLPYAGLMLLGGRLADLTGRRTLLLAGLLVFAVASACGGAAQEGWQLIAARAVQGVAAAVLSPMSLALVTSEFPEGPARSKAMAVWGGAGAAGGAFGVVMSGLLTDNLSWRWVMWVNLVFVGVAVVTVLRGIGNAPVARRGAIDVLGAVSVTIGMTALVAAVISTDTHSWGSVTVLGWFAGGIVALAVFVWAELRAADPLVPLGFLRRRSLIGATVFGFLLVSAQIASFYFVSQFLQRVLGYSSTVTGLSFLPFCVGVVVGLRAAQAAIVRVGSRQVVVVGGLVGALGLAWFGQAGVDSNFFTAVLGPSLVCSIGIGAAMVATGVAGVAGVAAEQAGLASGVLNSSRQLGGSLGLAVLVTIAGNIIGNSQAPADLADGYTTALTIAAGLLVVGSVAAALILPGRPKAVPDADASTEEAAPGVTVE